MYSGKGSGKLIYHPDINIYDLLDIDNYINVLLGPKLKNNLISEYIFNEIKSKEKNLKN